MHFRRSLPKKTAVERTRKPEKLSRRQAAKLIYIDNSGRCTMLPELEKDKPIYVNCPGELAEGVYVAKAIAALVGR